MMTQAFRTEGVIAQHGKLLLKGLPFRKGEQVEIIILPQSRKEMPERYPLRQKPLRYEGPFDGVGEDDWVVLR
jgi:hypothetical protein